MRSSAPCLPAFATTASALVVSAPAPEVGRDAAGLGEIAVTAVVEEAKLRWSEALGPERASTLDTVRVAVAELPDAGLGLTQGRTVFIDTTAAGHGWFVDPTPRDDSEYGAGVARSGEAARRVDLLSAIVHELGHVLGLEHGDGDAMAAGLRPGARLTSGGSATLDPVAPAPAPENPVGVPSDVPRVDPARIDGARDNVPTQGLIDWGPAREENVARPVIRWQVDEDRRGHPAFGLDTDEKALRNGPVVGPRFTDWAWDSGLGARPADRLPAGLIDWNLRSELRKPTEPELDVRAGRSPLEDAGEAWDGIGPRALGDDAGPDLVPPGEPTARRRS